MNNTTIEAVMVGIVQPFGPNGEPSAIRKRSVDGPVLLGPTGLAGDAQAYHTHGGVDKALLHHAAEHYEMWANHFPHFRLTPGGFGENIFTRGMTEKTVCIGDRYRIGQKVVVEVSQPRQPCWKLGLNAQEREIPSLMQECAVTGWYYRVLNGGPVRAGATMELIERTTPEWTLARLITAFYGTPLDREFLQETAELDALQGEWRVVVENRLSTGVVEDWDGRMYGNL